MKRARPTNQGVPAKRKKPPPPGGSPFQLTTSPPWAPPKITALPLGAGQDVGRSCILVTLGGKRIMFDCGIHMGFMDEKRFPDFTKVGPQGGPQNLDAVIVTHFHLDHCGALPHYTEIWGYSGPLYMTFPTKSICPILLRDYRKIAVERQGVAKFYTNQDIDNCMAKTTGVRLKEWVTIGPDFRLKAYYAGHVLGAAMFYVETGGCSVLYTGDYNMTADRHLGAANCERLWPDLMITESTYATMVRESRRVRERNFLNKVHECINNGGKVLIPVFALGRAQEIMILVTEYWDRMALKVPIFFSAGLAQKSNEYYKFFIPWCNESIQDTFSEKNIFNFERVKHFDTKSDINHKGPCVVLATPGMLHAGTSLYIFKHWCGDSNNMVVLPGYCVPRTLGGKVMGGAKEVTIEGKVYPVKIKVANLSFSAHADQIGIMRLIRQVQPKNVMLVHGEPAKMENIKKKIEKELGIDTKLPANFETVTFDCWNHEKAIMSSELANRLERNRLKRKRIEFCMGCRGFSLSGGTMRDKKCTFHPVENETLRPGALFVERKSGQETRVVTAGEFQKTGGTLRTVNWETHLCHLPVEQQNPEENGLSSTFDSLKRNLSSEFTVTMQTGILGMDDGVMVENTTDKSKVRVTQAERKPGAPQPTHRSVPLRMTYELGNEDMATLVQSILYVVCDSYC